MKTGIYVNDKYAPFTDEMIKKLKQYETRKKRTLSRFIGQRVEIIRTGKGHATVIGTMTIDGETVFDEKPDHITRAIKKMIDQSRIDGTPFAWDQGRKVFYHITDVCACDPYPLPENAIKTRVYAQWED